MILLFLISQAWANTGPQVATLTRSFGLVQVFTEPTKALPQDKKDKKADGSEIAFYEGEYFKVKKAQAGQAVEYGNIVRAMPGAKAKLIYPNGDQIFISSGTAYRVKWDKKTGSKTNVELMYGRIRMVVEKGGPRSQMTVKTRTAVMGVRGTDFFISDNGKESGSVDIAVLRGAVAVKNDTTKETQVSAGETVEVKNKITEDVRQVSKEELTVIKEETTVPVAPKEEIAKITEAENKKLEVLEKKAIETTIADIKKVNPELVKNMSLAQLTDTSSVNDLTVNSLIQTAPSLPEKKKPFRGDFERVDQDVYKKYFKQ